MTCCRSINEICHHPSADTYYTAYVSEEISAITGLTSPDTALTLSDQLVIDSDTDVTLPDGGTRTIPANWGIRWRMSGGTVGHQEIEAAVTLPDGSADVKVIRVDVCTPAQLGA